MARMYTGSYQGYDGLWHHPYIDPDTGERGEDLSVEPPEETPGMAGPPRAELPTGTRPNFGPDPWLSAAATQVGLPLNQPIPSGFTAPGATLPEAVANAQMHGQPFGQLGARPAAGTMLPGGGLQAYSNWGKDPVTIRPEYVEHLGNTALLPGYLPGSGEYNQFRLDQPGLLGEIPGQSGVVPLRFGLGGTGDPTTGGEVQTPELYVRGSGSSQALRGDAAWRAQHGGGVGDWGVMRPVPTGGGGGAGGGMGGGADAFFTSARTSNWGQGDQAGTGLDYIATLFLRPDTPTGINTAAWSAPPQMWAGLAEQIRTGQIRVNNPLAWQMLAEKGYTPQKIGGAALDPTLNPTIGGQSPTGTGQSGFGQGEYFNYQAGLLANQAAEIAYQRTYHEWLARHGDAELAEQQAQFAKNEAFRNAQLDFQKQQQQQNTGLQAAQLMASLRGPANAFAAANALYGLNRTTGVPNAVAALAGEYAAPSFQAPQALPQAATLQTLAQQLGAAGTGTGADMTTQAQQFAAALPTPNKVVGRQFAGLSPDTQQLVLAGYESLGFSPADTLNTIQAGLPQFKAPAFGAVS